MERQRCAVIIRGIFDAVQQGNLDDVQILVEEGADVNANTPEDYGGKLIHAAAQFGYKDVVQFLLNKGVNIDESDQYGWTPLHYAAQNGHADVARCLLEKGADVENKNRAGRAATPLHIAACNGRLEVVQVFIEFGINPNSFGANGDTPLHNAAKGCLNVAEYLIESGSNINAPNSRGEKPIHFAAQYGSRKVLEFFLDKGLNIDERDDAGWTPLHYATANLNLDLMKWLVDKGANVTARTNVGVSPLCMAAMYRPPYDVLTSAVDECVFHETNHKIKCMNQDILDFLILKDNGINEANEGGFVPLRYAVDDAVGRRVDYIVEKLVDAGAKSDTQGCDGKTPLHRAVEENYLSAVEKIIQARPFLDTQDNEGNTPLHLSCKNNRTQIMKCLFEAGARPDIKDNNGRTVLFYYVCDYIDFYEENPLLAQEILEKIDDYVDIDEKENKTAAHLVVERDGDMEFLELVLQNQKDLNIEDINGDTPLNYLTDEWPSPRDRCAELIRLFIDNGAYFKPKDCQRIISNLSLRNDLFTDIKLCTQSIVNKFNYKDLPMLYGLHSSVSLLPPIEKMRINTRQMRKIEHSMEAEIRNRGYWDVSKMFPTSLTTLCIESYIFHYDSASCP